MCPAHHVEAILTRWVIRTRELDCRFDILGPDAQPSESNPRRCGRMNPLAFTSIDVADLGIRAFTRCRGKWSTASCPPISAGKLHGCCAFGAQSPLLGSGRADQLAFVAQRGFQRLQFCDSGPKPCGQPRLIFSREESCRKLCCVASAPVIRRNGPFLSGAYAWLQPLRWRRQVECPSAGIISLIRTLDFERLFGGVG
jgi:hypothetical protein